MFFDFTQVALYSLYIKHPCKIVRYGLVWFIKDVFPLLKENIKNSLFVMGGGLSKEYQEIYLKPNKINYLGFVENSYARIVQSSAAIVPLFTGAGVKVKVLDSFTAGTPVIGT